MDLPPVHAPTKAEAAYDALRDAIRGGVLRPGQRVTLVGLAEQLGMSLTPVREALRRLAEQGLVHQVPNQGTVIAEPSRARAEEIYRLRLVLEPLAAELAARNITDDELADIESVTEDLETAVAENRAADVATLNATLHRLIYAAARSTYLLDFIDKLWNGVPFQAISLAGRHERSMSEHRAIVAALRAHDAADARALMTAHISDAAEHAMRCLDEIP